MVGGRGWLAIAVGAVLLVAFSVWRDRRTSGKLDELAARVAARDSVITLLLARVGKTDTLFRLDTVTLTRARTVYRTRVDSIRRTDTLTVRERVIVAAADTAIQKCQNVVLTCERRVSQRDSVIALLHQQAHDEHQIGILAARPKRFIPFAELLYNATAGGIAGRAGVDVQLFRRLSATASALGQAGQPVRALVGVRFAW